MRPFDLLVIVTLLILFEYWVFTTIVSVARYRFKIAAPAVTGHPIFERLLRVQMNTMEQMVLFGPLMWTFAGIVSELWAVYLGVLWIIGRGVYAYGYYKLNFMRTIGFGIATVATLICLFGSLVMAIILSY